MITKTILQKRLTPLLERSGKAGEPVEMLQLNIALGVDVVSSFFFGLDCGSNFVEDCDGRRAWMIAYADSHNHRDMFVRQELPWLERAFKLFGLSISTRKCREGTKFLERWCQERCSMSDERLRESTVDQPSKGDYPLAYNHLKQMVEKQKVVKMKDLGREVQSEILDHLGKSSRLARFRFTDSTSGNKRCIRYVATSS